MGKCFEKLNAITNELAIGSQKGKVITQHPFIHSSNFAIISDNTSFVACFLSGSNQPPTTHPPIYPSLFYSQSPRPHSLPFPRTPTILFNERTLVRRRRIVGGWPAAGGQRRDANERVDYVLLCRIIQKNPLLTKRIIIITQPLFSISLANSFHFNFQIDTKNFQWSHIILYVHMIVMYKRQTDIQIYRHEDSGAGQDAGEETTFMNLCIVEY